ncbi:HNH endonuclease [Rhizobium leguminosarum bv. viciae]|uniref:HNH endonuclease n=1 Tax=Rhizobium leguminosarum TaxID=384 RepID=UPI001039F57E|nr:HNH endonuclease signature motif containing protein [Rhizobium leguminosarum]TCA40084.1 HNH endonuclease [Rhizobium leguminosarum bv. viciae]
MRNFVFLNLPESFRLVEALAEGKREFWWRTTRLKNEIEIGDRVFMWQGKGKEEQFRGVHAIAEVVEKPRKLDLAEFDGYWVGDKSKATNDDHTLIKILEYARHKGHLRQGDIHNVPLLLRRGVFDGAQGVNFRLSEAEAEELYTIWRLHAEVVENYDAPAPPDSESRHDENARGMLEQAADSLANRTLEELAALIKKSRHDRSPLQQKITVAGIPRDPAIVAYARRRAGYKCEVDNCAVVPFETANGLPFVEVHHILPLGKGGRDSVQNVACLCPAHHREVHHGKHMKAITNSLIQKRV